jgi:hypothetical protein
VSFCGLASRKRLLRLALRSGKHSMLIWIFLDGSLIRFKHLAGISESTYQFKLGSQPALVGQDINWCFAKFVHLLHVPDEEALWVVLQFAFRNRAPKSWQLLYRCLLLEAKLFINLTWMRVVTDAS